MMTKLGGPRVKASRASLKSRRSPARTAQKQRESFLVVGIGASAGGLAACTKLLAALRDGIGMAFILIQHLDPTHESMMVDLLASHTAMRVCQAADGMRVERDHFYVIPPGSYLSVSQEVLRVSRPLARHGARLPFDFLLNSLAQDYGPRAVCIVLSGTGADGSIGLKAVQARQGLVIAQEPDEASHDGMPRSAILSGGVGIVLPVSRIPQALLEHGRRGSASTPLPGAQAIAVKSDLLPALIELLRSKTSHDFTLYKRGTLQRRIERRMAMAGINADGMDLYLALLRRDLGEIKILAQDLLINVTSFFRDAAVFDLLEKGILHRLVESHPRDLPLRIWIAGCSTGEETYSLAMLLREHIALAKAEIKLQIFASDVDPDAVATAREGVYPQTIEADIAASRLARFFSKHEHGYRVSPELRATVVFATQDVLSDPPFSRLDMVSCRNLLIYLGPEAQEKVISTFHFALRDGGILLLGNSETVSKAAGRFEPLSKLHRIYRRVGNARSEERPSSTGSGDAGQSPIPRRQTLTPTHHLSLAELCRKMVMQSYAPAAVLINRNNEYLYSVGPIDRYLRVASGHASHDLLGMAPQALRPKLRSAIRRATLEKSRIIVPAGRINQDGQVRSFSLDIQPVTSESEAFLLICFVEDAAAQPRSSLRSRDIPRVAELELELQTVRADLQGAIHDLEVSAEEQKTINEEALSVNEEYQSTNEELLTSKEETQSLNEELTALNSQLQETLERQRTMSNDLQNILYSTDVAILFLDTDLNIRFFTPATKSLFNVLLGDIGRPMADLNAMSAGSALAEDAGLVLQSRDPIEREIEISDRGWFTRCILPYRTHENDIDGVVITFTDITQRKRADQVLEGAKQQAESASFAKSRFLAAASHDLRQPLQTLTLLQGLLAKTVQSDASQNLVSRMDQAVGAMSGMLNALLDINQIEAGIVKAEISDFKVGDLLSRLHDEFSYHARAAGLTLHVVSCGLSISSDANLLEQMIRNLLSNALKYTRHGKVLLGCRRHQHSLSIEVWDTGIGIPADAIEAIFEEYRQLDNSARERARGLGLGLSIVQRLGTLLGHRIQVRSRPGKGSVFAIEVMLAPTEVVPDIARDPTVLVAGTAEASRSGSILVVDDDPAIRDPLGAFLGGEGYRVATAHDGIEALRLLDRKAFEPDLILTDFSLPNGRNGLELAETVRRRLHRMVPAIILTGDISTDALREIGGRNVTQFTKPVKLRDLTQVIQQLLGVAATVNAASAAGSKVFIVDDDSQVLDSLGWMLEQNGHAVEVYPTSEAFLAAYQRGAGGCLLIDAYLPGMSGLDLLRHLRASGDPLPTILITGNSDVHMAVEAMKAGASDFIEKPIGPEELLACIERAFRQSHDAGDITAWRQTAAVHLAELTARQRQIMDFVLAGHSSKTIAAKLGISQRTVENHRAAIMKKTGTKSLPALARLALAAAGQGESDVPHSR